jgi:hypothetical protein
MCSTFLRATMVRPKTALTAVETSRRHPRNPLSREAVQPAPTSSTVATARETLMATNNDAPRAPITNSVASGMKDGIAFGYPVHDHRDQDADGDERKTATGRRGRQRGRADHEAVDRGRDSALVCRCPGVAGGLPLIAHTAETTQR